MEFYLHYSDVPVSVAGLQTKYIINTTKLFSFLTLPEAYANSFYKPIGLPKIVVDFYLYPNLAGPVTFNGSWQVFIWVNASAYKPATFTLEFKEITIGGDVLWDSGVINPVVASSIGAYVDVPIYCYNLSTSLAHTFNPGTTLLVEVEVNAGSAADTRIWFDSPLFPSKVILPAEDYARPAWIKTYSVDNSETNLFYYNASESERIVIVRANVTDPFGGYDIHKVNLTIVDPEGNHVIDNDDMTRVSDDIWFMKYSNVFEMNWSYPTTASLGNYTVIVSVIDNNGHHHFNESGTYYPFIEEETHIFTMGIIVYYDPAFLITDDVGEPLPNAQVYITWRNGTTDILPRYTTIEGFINLTQVPAGNYGFTILWKDLIVKQTTIYVDSNGPYTIRTQVFQLTVNVFGNDGSPIHGAYVIVYAQSEVGYGLDITGSAGRAIFKLPSGTYRIEAYYAADYWLTTIKSSATASVTVSASTSKNLILTNFPPAIWSTTGFWLLTIFIIAVMIAAVYTLFIFSRRTHPPK
ncbi:MAG: hypothetical protein QXK47_05695 [Candidatus Bathyarchaeia archaeon]